MSARVLVGRDRADPVAGQIDGLAVLVRLGDQAVQRIETVLEEIGARVGDRCQIVGLVTGEASWTPPSASRVDG